MNNQKSFTNKQLSTQASLIDTHVSKFSESLTEFEPSMSNDIENKAAGKLRRTAQQKHQIKEDGQTLVIQLSAHLQSHTQRNLDINHVNHKIFHLLGNPFTFINAYTKISKNKDVLTVGIAEDKQINKFFGLKEATNISKMFRSNSYQWASSLLHQRCNRTWISKSGKKTKRPIDTLTQKDRIVQEAIRGILEAIYEPEFQTFSKGTENQANNYGFRPNLSTWDAVNAIKHKGKTATYAIEGDIVSPYKNVNHDVLIKILSRRITDKKFLKLINHLLKAGVMDRNIYQHSINGTSTPLYPFRGYRGGLHPFPLKGVQMGGCVSSLLFNIYMFEFDKFIYETIMKEELTPQKPQHNKKHHNFSYAINKALRLYRSLHKGSLEKKQAYKVLKQLLARRNTILSQDIQTLTKKSVYVRYADDWVLLITGPEKDALQLRHAITSFFRDTLKMELDPQKTLVSRLDEGFSFLGFSVFRSTNIKNARVLRTTRTFQKKTTCFFKRVTSRQIKISPDRKRLSNKLLESKFCQGTSLEPIGIRHWAQFDEFDIVLKYRQIMTGIANYYRNCDKIRFLNRVSYILQYSCAKTIATRQRSTIFQVFKKYGKNLRITRELKGTKFNKTRSVQFPTSTDLRQQSCLSYNPHFRFDEYDPFRI